MHSCLSLQDTLTTEHVQTLFLLPHHCLSFSLKYWKCLPHYSALAFSTSSHLIPHSRSSSLWRSKWRQRSYLLSSSSPAKLAVVASVDSCRHLSPLLWRASEQTSCSFVAFSVSSTTGLFTHREQEGNPHYKPCQGHCSPHTNLPTSTHIRFYSAGSEGARISFNKWKK